MTEDQIKEILQTNYRLLYVMGYATSVLMDIGRHVPAEEKGGLYWVIEAIEKVIYLDKPLPTIPSKYDEYCDVSGVKLGSKK